MRAAEGETKKPDGWLAPKSGRPSLVFFSLAMSRIRAEGGAELISAAALAAHWRRQTHGRRANAHNATRKQGRMGKRHQRPSGASGTGHDGDAPTWGTGRAE